MGSLALIFFGVMLLVTPLILMMLSGAETEDDVIRWLTRQPLGFIIAIRAMMFSGLGLLMAGAATNYLPS